MGLFSNSQAKDRAKDEAARQGLLAATAVESIAGASARTTAAEQARARVAGMLGAPGTYGTDFQASGVGFGDDLYQHGTAATQKDATARGLITASDALNKPAKLAWGISHDPTKRTPEERQDIIDPEKYAAAESQTAQFQIRSLMTAQAKQLVEGQGPLWDKLNQSTIGQIIEGAGVQAKEAARDIQNQAAKGGSARRNALITAQNMVAREQAIQTRVHETWQANLALQDYVTNYANNVQEGNQKFLDNLPLISQQYTQTMNSLSGAMVEATRASSDMSHMGYMGRAAVEGNQFLDKLVAGSIGIVGGAALAMVPGLQGVGGAMMLGGVSGIVGGGTQSSGADAQAAGQGVGGLLQKGTSYVRSIFGGGGPNQAAEAAKMQGLG